MIIGDILDLSIFEKYLNPLPAPGPPPIDFNDYQLKRKSAMKTRRHIGKIHCNTFHIFFYLLWKKSFTINIKRIIDM